MIVVTVTTIHSRLLITIISLAVGRCNRRLEPSMLSTLSSSCLRHSLAIYPPRMPCQRRFPACRGA